MNKSDAFLGIGWGFPIQFRANGKDLITTSGSDNISKSIWVILNTLPGERVMVNNFGSGLQNLHFETLNSKLINNLKRTISKSILLHEPRVQLDYIQVLIPDKYEGALTIELEYTVKNTNSRYNMVFPFYLESSK